MRYAIFTDVHANLEALEAVLTKLDELNTETPIDEIWFLGDLVGYGPNPNECIRILRERTDVILAGNHDWAAIGKLDLDDFSPIARISAEWTAKQLTEEHAAFLKNLPERIVLEDCTLVHGSPYGPLWEYLTSEALAERSFQCFDTRYCFVGHTHVPVIFQQPDTLSNTPTSPLASFDDTEDDEETQKMIALRPAVHISQNSPHERDSSATVIESGSLQTQADIESVSNGVVSKDKEEQEVLVSSHKQEDVSQTKGLPVEASPSHGSRTDEVTAPDNEHSKDEEQDVLQAQQLADGPQEAQERNESLNVIDAIANLGDEVEELLALLGLSQSMLKVTNEMLTPPIGDWRAPDNYRAIVNPGGVGQPRDSNPRAAFMIFDTEKGFTFYRIPYDYEKTQQKIIEVGLPPYLAARLAYGR